MNPKPAPRPPRWGATILAYGRLIRFSHTVFGLPFAMAAMLLAHGYAANHGSPGLTAARVGWIIVAFTGARSAAMGFNRIVDRHIDAQNPRTADRELPRGEIGLGSAWVMTGLAVAAFVLAAAMLGPWPLRLAPGCLVVIAGYSYFKRFSWTSHLVLGVALALAPGGAWLAVTGSFDGWTIPLTLMVAVATWVAGFDVLYSLADEAFDRKTGLHSIPVRFGRTGALWFSGALHLVTAGCLIALHLTAGLGWLHAVGVLVIVGVLAYEHSIVRPSDLSRLGKAFFDLNGYISLVYLGCVLLDTVVT